MILDKIESLIRYRQIEPLAQAISFIESTDFNSLPLGKTIVNDNMFIIYNEYQTGSLSQDFNNVLESHKKYLDLQYIIKGSEIIDHEIYSGQKIVKEYDSKEDYMLYKVSNVSRIVLNVGMFVIFYPEDLHMPGRVCNERTQIKKAVIKIRID